MFGDYTCYPPLILFEESLKLMSKVNPSPEFIINSGDIYPSKSGNSADYIYIMNTVTKITQKYFPGVPII